MELQNQQIATPLPDVQQPAPPPAERDGRVAADAAATTLNPRPEVPLPLPASPSQTGLVSKASLSDKDAAPKLDTSGVSAAQRTLKPYGIEMLPERKDPSQQETPPQT